MKKEKNKLGIAIIGMGLIGKRRLEIARGDTDVNVVGVYDLESQRSQGLDIKTYENLDTLLSDPEVECVIVATLPESNVEITKKALLAGKHVLVEKPLAWQKKVAEEIVLLSRETNRLVKVGFNHRHHPALMEAHNLVEAGKIGELMYIKASYGHGGREGYGKEWRMQSKISVGGELFDQGVHIIDLAYWFLGPFSKVCAVTRNYFWKDSDLEDNAFCILETEDGKIAQIHASVTEWKNNFSFQIYGTTGYIHIKGLGKSYGIERLVLGQQEELGRPYLESNSEYPGRDISWEKEWEEFKAAVTQSRRPLADAQDNVEVVKALEGLYISAREGKKISI